MTTFVIRVFVCLALSTIIGCKQVPSCRHVYLAGAWVESIENITLTGAPRLVLVEYLMDAGSIVVFAEDGGGRRLDIILSSPGLWGGAVELRLRTNGQDVFGSPVAIGSETEQLIYRLLACSTVDPRVLHESAPFRISQWIRARRRDEGIESVVCDGPVIRLHGILGAAGGGQAERVR